jgi:hypothetical protein
VVTHLVNKSLDVQLSRELNWLNELEILNKLLFVDNQFQKYVVMETYRNLRGLQIKLGLSKETHLDELVTIFKCIEEIREVFDLQTSDINQLYELLIENTKIKRVLKLPLSISLSALLSQLDPEMLPLCGVGPDSLLCNLLMLFWLK